MPRRTATSPAPGTYDAYSPLGVPIVGTEDHIPARANILSITVDTDGTFDPVWEGGTDVYWDGQLSCYEGRRERIYLDERDKRWRESELVLVPEGASFTPRNVPKNRTEPYCPEDSTIHEAVRRYLAAHPHPRDKDYKLLLRVFGPPSPGK